MDNSVGLGDPNVLHKEKLGTDPILGDLILPTHRMIHQNRGGFLLLGL